jgi:acetolactate synthase I/II/III large subunit
MHGGRLVAKALAAHGVRYVFGLCGDHVNAIFDGCADESIPIIDTRHEAAAVHMAQGWSLATGEPGVAVVTGGPGLMNAITPIADAKLAGIPLVVITSTIRQSEVGRGYPQDMDQMAVARSITVRAETVRSTDALIDSVHDAVGEAHLRRGPMVLEIPMDLQLARVHDPGHLKDRTGGGIAGFGLEATSRAADILRRSERPVAIVGEGAYWSALPADVADFAERTGVPIFTIRAARGLIPDSHELCFGPPNYLRGPGTVAFPNANVLLVVGTELDISLMFGNLAPNAKIIRIDADGDRLTRHKKPDFAIHELEGEALRQLAGDGPSGERDRWLKELREVAVDDEPELRRGAVHPATLAAHVRRAIGERGSIALDAGALALWAHDRLPATGPGRMLSTFTTPLGALGPGLPFAMAAKLARPDEPSVALVGDGAFGFSAMELDTAARHGIDVKVVVGNDASWGIVRRQMELGFGRSVAATLADRSYDELARSLGCSGERIDDARELPAALARLMKTNGPAVLDVKLDGSVDHPAVPFIAQMFAPEQR